MKYQILFSGKNKKTISKCCLLKILPRVLSDNTDTVCISRQYVRDFWITCGNKYRNLTFKLYIVRLLCHILVVC